MTIDIDTTFDQFRQLVLDLRKISRGNPDKLATAKAQLLLEVERVRGADRKEARVWSNFIKDTFKPRVPKNKSHVDEGLEQKSSAYRVKLITEGGSYPTGLLQEIRKGLNEVLYKPDPAMLDFTFSIAASHYLREKSDFGLMVGPPSSGKTEHLALLAKVPEMKQLDSLTPRTLMSGFKDEETGESMALLKRFPNPLFVYEDFGSVLSAHPNDRIAVLGQLLRLYDGKLNNDTGIGTVPPWYGHATLIAGVTNEIYDYFLTMAKMGPRFLFLQIEIPNRDEQAYTATGEIPNKKATMDRLVDLTGQFFDELPIHDVLLTDYDRQWLGKLGELMSRTRSVISRNKQGDVNEITDPEGPGRLTKEIRALMKSHALVNNAEQFNRPVMEFALRVGLNSLTPIRHYVLSQLYLYPGMLVKQLTNRRFSEWMVERAVNDLEVLGLIDSHTGTGDVRDKAYTLVGEVKAKLDFLHNIQYIA